MRQKTIAFVLNARESDEFQLHLNLFVAALSLMNVSVYFFSIPLALSQRDFYSSFISNRLCQRTNASKNNYRTDNSMAGDAKTTHRSSSVCPNKSQLLFLRSSWVLIKNLCLFHCCLQFCSRYSQLCCSQLGSLGFARPDVRSPTISFPFTLSPVVIPFYFLRRSLSFQAFATWRVLTLSHFSNGKKGINRCIVRLHSCSKGCMPSTLKQQ